MTRHILKFLILFAFIGCRSNSTAEKEASNVQTADTIFESANHDAVDSDMKVRNKSLLWQVEGTETLKLHKPTVPGIDTMSAKSLIQIINNNYDSIHLDYIKTSHDTIYVHIPHSEMLTQRIGSTGAEMYMASATWSLTELRGIRYVNYDFEEGDHASPGVYTRNNFKKPSIKTHDISGLKQCYIFTDSIFHQMASIKRMIMILISCVPS